MRKLSVLVAALLGLSFLAACGDDPEEAEKMAENCVAGGLDEATCECVGENASDEMSTSEYNEMAEGKNDEAQEKYDAIVADCVGEGGVETDDGTDEEMEEEAS